MIAKTLSKKQWTSANVAAARLAWPLLGAAICALAFVMAYVNAEDGIYLWDFRAYWDRYAEFASLIAIGDVRGIGKQLALIVQQDYNVTSVLPLQPAALIFGDSRSAYIAAIVVAYLLPLAFLLAHLGTLLNRPNAARDSLSTAENKQCAVILFLFAMTFPAFWVPTLRGYPDIVGLLPLSIATILLLRTDFSASGTVRRALMIGVLLWAAFLFRRWYAYAIVAFLTSSFAYSLVESRALLELNWLRARRVLFHYFLVAGSALICAILFQGPLLLRILTTDYKETFEFYQVSPLEHISAFVAFFGGGHLAMAAAGLVTGTLNPATRPATIFIACNTLLIFFLFTRTQAFGPHHYLAIAFWIFLLETIAILRVRDWLRTPRVAAISMLAASVIIFAGAFFAYPPWVGASLVWLIPASKFYPLTFPNRERYDSLLSDIERVTATGGKVTAFGYDTVMSDELLYALARQRSRYWLVRTAHVDKRDHFKIEPLLARYVVIIDPLTGGETANLQHVVSAPGDRILRGYGIGKAYKRLLTNYDLGSNVTAYIFERIRPFKLEEVDELLEHLFALFPDWRNDYDLARLLLISEWTGADKSGKIELSTPDNLRVWPAREQPLIIHFAEPSALGGSIKELRLSIMPPFVCAPLTNARASVQSKASVLWAGLVPPATSNAIRIMSQAEPIASVEVGPSLQAGCAYVNVHFVLERQ